MRPIIIAAAACISIAAMAIPARAQDAGGWQLVALGGVTQGSLSGSNQPFADSGSRTAFAGGVGLLWRVNDDLGWEFGLRYAQKGADGTVDLTDYTGPVTDTFRGEGTTRLDYLELPVAFAGYLPTSARSYLRGYLGVSLGYLLDATFEGTLEGDAAEVDLGDTLEDFDFCWLVGASWAYEFEKFSLWIDGRYAGGTRSIDKSAREYDIKTSTREITAGVGFPLGG